MTNRWRKGVLALGAGFVLATACASPALPAQGDCGQPVSTGDKPAAADALAILKAAVGQAGACSPRPCICDVSGNGLVQASDALIALKVAVGQSFAFACSCAATTTTSSTSSTSSTSTSVTTSTSTTTLPPAEIGWPEIQAVFAVSCASCHGGETENGGLGGIDNEELAYAELLEETVQCQPSALAGNTRVVPGDPAASFLMHKLDGTQDCGERMPKEAPSLSPAFRDAVRAWIADGAPRGAIAP